MSDPRNVKQHGVIRGNASHLTMVAGDYRNYEGGADLRIRTPDEKRPPIRSRDQGSPDLDILNPYSPDTISLVGREAELADLQKWTDSASRISIRTLVGCLLYTSPSPRD